MLILSAYAVRPTSLLPPKQLNGNGEADDHPDGQDTHLREDIGEAEAVVENGANGSDQVSKGKELNNWLEKLGNAVH